MTETTIEIITTEPTKERTIKAGYNQHTTPNFCLQLLNLLLFVNCFVNKEQHDLALMQNLQKNSNNC